MRGGGTELKLLSQFNGFTLSEVLITLGIIGIVAALTMPALINNA
ncbi:MAG: type II secretion system protein, partial [Candidatus Gastranaerophilaceae bacterium]